MPYNDTIAKDMTAATERPLLEAGNAFDEPLIADAWWSQILEEDAAAHAPATPARAA